MLLLLWDDGQLPCTYVQCALGCFNTLD